jgi:hypothetical protein
MAHTLRQRSQFASSSRGGECRRLDLGDPVSGVKSVHFPAFRGINPQAPASFPGTGSGTG